MRSLRQYLVSHKFVARASRPKVQYESSTGVVRIQYRVQLDNERTGKFRDEVWDEVMKIFQRAASRNRVGVLLEEPGRGSWRTLTIRLEPVMK